MDLLDRLSDKFLVGDDCWTWTAGLDRRGYGRIRVGDKTAAAHRVVYELLSGPIPEGLSLDHLCRNPSCVRPDHLEPVTHAENVRRGAAGENQRAKTHCPRGHEYTPENTYNNPRRPNRACQACRALRRQESGAGPSNRTKTHCPRGHEYTQENTYQQVRNGSVMRSCIACRRNRGASD